MEILVEHLGAVQFQIQARNHTIECDQPVENGGFDEGMTPPELLLASLGACAGYYATEFLKKRNLAPEGTIVHVTAEKAKDPARLDNFRISVEVPAPLTLEQHSGIEMAVKHCLIHNTLLHPPRITFAVKAAEPQLV